MSMIENPNEFNLQDWLTQGHQIWSDYADSTKAVYDPDVPEVPMFEENAYESGYTQEYKDAHYQAYLDTGGDPEGYIHSLLGGDMRKLHFNIKKAEHGAIPGDMGVENSTNLFTRLVDAQSAYSGSVSDGRFGKNLGNRPMYYGEGEDQSIVSPYRLMKYAMDKYNPLQTTEEAKEKVGSSSFDIADEMSKNMFFWSNKGKGGKLAKLLHPYKKDFKYNK